MSVHVLSWVLKNSDETLGRRLVLIVLADHARDDGTGAWPSVQTIARETRMSERQVQRCLRDLEGSEAIERTGRHRVEGQRHGTFIYAVKMKAKGDNVSPLEAPKGDIHAAKGDKSGAQRVSQMSPKPSLEPSLEPSLTSLPSTGPPATRRRRANLPFDALVAACPGTDPSADGGRIAKALTEIRRRLEFEAQQPAYSATALELLAADSSPLDNGRLAEEIERRAQLYRRRWPEAELTPTALSKHWTRVLTQRPGTGARVASIATMFDDER